MESVLFIYVFFEFLCGPANCLSRLWYRVSDVLHLSLMSKRFGFWTHITHVIVLTFKEIKHLSDYRTVGLSARRTIGLSDYRTVGLSDCQNIGLSDYRSDPSGFTAARTFMACITGIATYPFSKQYSIKLQMQIYIWFDLLCLTSLSAIFQQYHGDQF